MESRYTINGVSVPRVSDAVELLCGEFHGSSETAATDGKNIHLACQYDDQAELDDSNLTEYMYQRLRAWRRYKKINKDLDFSTQIIEEPLISRFGYGGTPDRVYAVRDAARFRIVDIKSGVKDFDRHQYQLIGYCQLVAEDLNVDIKQIELQAVYLQDGDFQLQDFKYTRELWQDFYSAVRVLNRRYAKLGRFK
jgi:hypothetical protein